jgi:AcrR family transcriptional regulator
MVRDFAAARRGGRPSRIEAEQLGEHILDVATDLILSHGYGATSIEAIAQRAGISKRTFYHRFRDKADLFGAVVHRLVGRMRPPDDASLFAGGPLDDTLRRLGRVILRAALSPQALALQRVIVAEAVRFPELAAVLDREGARGEAIARIAALLEQAARAAGRPTGNAAFAAEQFLQLIVSAPQRRALGLGTPLTAAELDGWVRDAVTLFLNGWPGLASA